MTQAERLMRIETLLQAKAKAEHLGMSYAN